MEDYQVQVLADTQEKINKMTDEINLRFNSLNNELVGSFDSFAEAQSSFKYDSEKALNEMLRVRN